MAIVADERKRLGANVAGEFFVDSTCINCDACRQLAPCSFEESGEYSRVYRQPTSDSERRAALRALVACPTGSIGGGTGPEVRAAADEFPLTVEDEVSYCGFNSEKSFGGNSYLVRHSDGNWLVDSPRYSERLVQKFEMAGGIGHIFLTHSDDVADAAKWARRFGAERIIHRWELGAQPDAEHVLDGIAPIQLDPDFLAIPTPGHTRGHSVLLYRDRFLFTGDHLWWSRERGRLNASRSVCWYSWPQQVSSMAVLQKYAFEWVLPGHGERAQMPAEQMRAQVQQLTALMRG
jgi:glyoxylase-like metal-dependent hydrolase (beta-lactamase superfamily II)/ferredoxin